MSSIPEQFSEDQKKLLLDVARAAVREGIEGKHMEPDPQQFAEPLRRPGASFVTLKKSGQLRGCIGTLEAHQPLVTDIAHNAYSAAFRDSRFNGVQPSELDDLEFELSILSEPEPMPVKSEADLLSHLRPNVDGLILQEGYRRSTFLPAVWESLGDPAEFVKHLKLKAGLPADYWSDTIRLSRYTAEHIP